MRQSKERVWCVLGPSRFQLTAKRAEGKKLKTCLAGRRVSEAAGHDVAGPGPAPRLVPWLRRSVKCSAVPRHTEASGHSGGGPPAPTRTESRHRCPTPCVADAARATALARTGREPVSSMCDLPDVESSEDGWHMRTEGSHDSLLHHFQWGSK